MKKLLIAASMMLAFAGYTSAQTSPNASTVQKTVTTKKTHATHKTTTGDAVGSPSGTTTTSSTTTEDKKGTPNAHHKTKKMTHSATHVKKDETTVKQ